MATLPQPVEAESMCHPTTFIFSSSLDTNLFASSAVTGHHLKVHHRRHHHPVGHLPSPLHRIPAPIKGSYASASLHRDRFHHKLHCFPPLALCTLSITTGLHYSPPLALLEASPSQVTPPASSPHLSLAIRDSTMRSCAPQNRRASALASFDRASTLVHGGLRASLVHYPADTVYSFIHAKTIP
jgi:hypothetical protein